MYLYATPNPSPAGAPAQCLGQCKRPKHSTVFAIPRAVRCTSTYHA